MANSCPQYTFSVNLSLKGSIRITFISVRLGGVSHTEYTLVTGAHVRNWAASTALPQGPCVLRQSIPFPTLRVTRTLTSNTINLFCLGCVCVCAPCAGIRRIVCAILCLNNGQCWWEHGCTLLLVNTHMHFGGDINRTGDLAAYGVCMCSDNTEVFARGYACFLFCVPVL